MTTFPSISGQSLKVCSPASIFKAEQQVIARGRNIIFSKVSDDFIH